MKTFLIGFFSLSVHSAKREVGHTDIGTHTGGFSTTAGVQGDVRFRVYGYTSIELIDCDGVLSAGFARHLAHRQRSIQTYDSSLDYILFHSLLLLAGLRRKKDPTLPLILLACTASAVSATMPCVSNSDFHWFQPVEERTAVTASIPRQLSTLPHQNIPFQMVYSSLNGATYTSGPCILKLFRPLILWSLFNSLLKEKCLLTTDLFVRPSPAMYFVFAMCIYTFLFFLLGVGRWLKSEPVWNRFTRRRRQLHSSCVTCPDVWKQRLGSPSPLGGFGLYCEPRVGQGQIATHPLVGARNTSFVTRWQNPLAVFVNLLIPSTEKYTKQEKHTLYIFLSYQKRNV